jgi:hypothetical protein
MTTALAIAALVIAVVSALAAIGSWRVAIRANRTSDRVAAIESARRHDELTPEFEIVCTPTGNTGDDAFLEVKLTGGPQQLDEVVITILDEAGQDHWAHGLPPNLSEEDADLFIWGPWEFNAGAREQVANYRTTRPRPYSRANGEDWDRLHLIRTRAGAWMSHYSADRWQAERSGPLRLQITSRLNGYEPWHLTREIDWKPSAGA